MIYQSANGQVSEKKHIYKTWVISYEQSQTTKGYLRGLEDSSIVISTSLNNSKIHPSSVELDIPSVKTIKFRRKNKIGRSILHGAMVGFASGGLIGLMAYDPNAWSPFGSAAEEGLAFGTMFGVVGGLVGLVIGPIKIKIPINGSQKTYENKKKKLSTYKY
jgi:hypothetical protein